MLEVQEQNLTFVVQNTYKYIYICKEHSIVCISTLMIINKIVLVVHWCYWLFSHGLKFWLNILFTKMHRTKYQESVNGNVAEIYETVAETRRLTRVSAVGLVTVTRVSVAAVTAESYHFFTCFRQVSVEGNKGFRKRNFMLTWAETLGNLPEIWFFFYISVNVIRPKCSRKYKVRSRIKFLPCFRWRNKTYVDGITRLLSGNRVFSCFWWRIQT